MEPLHIIALIGFITIIVATAVPSKEKLSEKYKGLDESKLKSVNESAKKVKALSLVAAFVIIPVAAGFILLKIVDSSSREMVINILALAIFGDIAAFSVYSKISSVTNSLLKRA